MNHNGHVVYRRLAIREERDVRAELGEAHDRYAARVPRFVPHRRLEAPPRGAAGREQMVSAATEATSAAPPRRGFAGRAWAAIVAAWGVLSGLAPHVLHHVGPLAGAALLAGFAGKAIFFALGLVLSVPLLRRLQRRFKSWLAPALAIGVFAAMFALSSLVIAPLITGGSAKPAPPGIQQPAGHASHHVG